jgi:hypothetical protein
MSLPGAAAAGDRALLAGDIKAAPCAKGMPAAAELDPWAPPPATAGPLAVVLFLRCLLDTSCGSLGAGWCAEFST